MPWNISAVAGNQLSGGSVRAYVLDGGVGFHGDLPNVISRISADPLMPVVNCYPHATHVAGIISAPRNNVGVVGVDSSVPVVSVSATQSGTKNATFNCGSGSPSIQNISLGLDQIKSLISASGRVGVINISINPQENQLNNFASATPLGQKMLSMATPVSGYPGAFIAQSAGNYGKLACRFAYDNLSTDDGIMVVGAVDINGQPVVKLNDINGFRNLPMAPNQAGSNFGPCAAIWAPGNNIYSTWATWNAALAESSPTALKARQSGNTTYNTYGQLSGTSMAAPHVAGVAAWLAETGNLTTPAQIEMAVRNYARTNGAKDPDPNPNPILMANAIGTSYIAQPTVEFAIKGVVNGNLNTNSATPFALSYESIGAQNCDLTGYLNNVIWYQHFGFNNKFNWGTVQLAPGSYRWKVDCRSAAATMNSAQATATVVAAPPAPTAAFSFNNVQQPNVATPGHSPAATLASTKEISYGTQQPFNFSYNSTNTSSCQLDTFIAATHDAYWTPWYSTAVPTYHVWPPVALERNYYWWQLTCTGTGGTVTTNFVAHVY